MLKVNRAMEQLISSQTFANNHCEYNSIIDRITHNTKTIKESIVYDTEGIDESLVDFKRIFKYVDDWTGYEIMCNEILVHSSELPVSQYIVFAKKLQDSLQSKFAGKRFVIYLCVKKDFIELRFHTYRKNEGLWLNDNLNEYDNPILCFLGENEYLYWKT